MDNLMISAVGLTRRFGAVTAVDHLDLSVRRGEIFGLVGPDGAGKTTTLRLCCGLLNPSAGSVSVAGLDVLRDLDSVKDVIGYMAQRFGLYTELTVDENMRFYADLFGVSLSQSENLAQRLLHMTRMGPFRTRRAGDLSGGMKQKLALMCTLLHRPQLLLLDEPTNGVDPVSRRDFWAILYGLVQGGMTVLITTAYLDEAERCNRVGLMYQGRLVRCAPPEELKAGLEEACYEVRSCDNRRAQEVLRGLSGVLSVAPSGDALHCFADAGLGQQGLENGFRAAGMDGVDVREVAPSMEDVFIALIRKVARVEAKDAW
jgi:ABC-2 type transport system ATP-binding protein